MRYRFSFWPLLCIISATLNAQLPEYRTPTLNIGDPAPPLRVREWLKGKPFQQFEKGQVYVIEFWATWCAPCRAAIPHLSDLAKKYKGKVTVLGIDIFGDETVSMEKVKAFVETQGNRMNYHVVAEDSNYMSADWRDAADQRREGIPRTFIVDQDGKLAWVGHPAKLHKVLPQVVNRKWNLKEALANHILNRRLDSLDMEAYYRLIPYYEGKPKAGDPARPELTLLAINSMVIDEPGLKYAEHIAYQAFVAYLRTDMKKALQYGRETIKSPGYRYPGSYPIMLVVEYYSDKLKLPPEIYCLGAEAYEAYIDCVPPYAEKSELQALYTQMADWYARGHKKSKAIRAQKKAIAALKSRKDFSGEDLAILENRLQQLKQSTN
jgi:thiol-disulfide isomerase/thioredoxin